MRHNGRQYLTQTDRTRVAKGFFQTARMAWKMFGFWGTLGRYWLQEEEVRRFVRDAASGNERAFRRDLLRRFDLIHRKIPCAHAPYQFVLMARYILDMKQEGPIVQCGCFKGGSTAKLSLLAARTGRGLYVFDSFEGLPEPACEEERFLEGDGVTPDYLFSSGEYGATLEEVKLNVKNYGCFEACQFVPGLFRESLPGFELRPAFVFIDVDFISSARECLKHLWPFLVPHGYWFTHEAAFRRYLQGILDPEWWHDNLGECPPLIMGGGSGLSLLAPGLAYFQKIPSNR